jgi:hypothetical protein
MKLFKECRKCNETKSFDEFHNDKLSKKDGKARWCKQCVKLNTGKWYSKNSEKSKESNKIWLEKNLDEAQQYRKNYYEQNKTEESSLYRRLRSKVNYSLTCLAPQDNYTYILGCSNKEFKQYIESFFTEGMSWKNYGKYWNLKCLVPFSDFQEQDKILCFHKLNLRPCERGDKIILNEQEKLDLIAQIKRSIV